MSIFANRSKPQSTIEPPFAKDLFVIGGVGIVLALILPFCIQDDGRIAHFWRSLPFILFMSVSPTRRYRVLEGLLASLALGVPMLISAALIVGGQDVKLLAIFILTSVALNMVMSWVDALRADRR